MMNIEYGITKDEGKRMPDTPLLLRPSTFLVRYSAFDLPYSTFDIHRVSTNIERHP
jgi:hypothetical protein